MNQTDIMHAPIALMFEAPVLECPVCGLPAEAHRFLGIRACRGRRWITFLPHLAPCHRICAAGFLGSQDPKKIHTGPGSCEFCVSGHEDVPDGDLVMFDETGDLELEAEKLDIEWSDDDDGDRFTDILE